VSETTLEFSVSVQDIRNYLASLPGDESIVGITDDIYSCLVAKTVRYKYQIPVSSSIAVLDGNRKLSAPGIAGLIPIPDDVQRVAEIFDEIGRVEGSLDILMILVTRAQVYAVLPLLRPEEGRTDAL
jgi:hypothetical protein